MELSKVDLGTAGRSINQAKEITLINLEWMQQFSDILAELMTLWSSNIDTAFAAY